MLEGFLSTTTSAVNFLCLAISLWLGFYIVTRSPRSNVAWLCSATLWSLCGYFLNHLTYVNHPSPEGTVPWWWGWGVTLALPFWFHMSVSLLPEEGAKGQRQWVIPIYFVSLNLMAMEAYTSWVFEGATTKLPIYNSTQRPGLMYVFLGAYLIAILAFSLYNLRLSWKQARSPLLRHQFATLIWAVSFAIFAGLYAMLSTWFGLDTPTLINSLSLGVGVALLGYGIARYNALVEGRVIRLDFIYASSAIGFVVGIYLLAAFFSDLVFNVPFVTFVFLILLTIATHSLYDGARAYLDGFFYRRRYGELRAKLRDFVHTTTPEDDVQDRVHSILQTLCHSLKVSKGFIARKESRGFRVIAGWNVELKGQFVPSEILSVEEPVILPSSGKPPGLNDMALIVPLHAGGEQVGAILLGEREVGGDYAEDDLDALEDCADAVASLVYAVRLQEQNVQQIDRLLAEFQGRERELQGRMREVLTETRPLVLDGRREGEVIALVEDALKHLDDYAYLGEHPLSRLHVVESRLGEQRGMAITHLDRGRALSEILIQTIEKLKPVSPQPSPPSREWHQYVILHDCYVMDKSNREVMNALYVGEGTFNRARRRAVRAIALALGEIEKARLATPSK